MNSELNHCPGLESNQHDPKVTSPSSYTALQDKCNSNRNLSKLQNQGGPKKVLSKPENGLNEPPYPHTDLSQIVTVWPDLPEHIKAAIKAMIQSHEGKA